MFDCHSHGLRGRGTLQTDVMIVGSAPAQTEMRTRQVYSGRTGQLLQASLRAVGVEFDECYVTNLLCWWSKDVEAEQIMECMPRLMREIEAVKPKVIVALGAPATKFFTGVKKAADVRGACWWSNELECWIIPTWQPAVVWEVSPATIADIVRDLAKIEYIKDKPRDFGHVDYEVVHSPVQAQRILDSDWIRTAQFMSLDIEAKWDGEKWTDDIRCLGISDGDLSYVIPERVLETGLTWPEDCRWTFHNAQFDTRVLRADLGVTLPIVEDTMLMSYSLDERGGSKDENEIDQAVGIHGLKKLAREYCGAGFYEIDLKTAPDEEVWKYNAQDAAYTARLAKLFYKRQLADGRTREVYETLTLPQMQVVRDEWVHGIHVDKEILNKVAVAWLEEWVETEEWLRQEAVAYGWPEPDFNFNSHPQLKRFIRNYLGIDVPNTQKGTLEEYVNQHEWLQKYQRIKRIDKQLGTYVLGTSNVLFEDGRVRPLASIHATMTGRLAYRKPPIGTVPSGAQYIDPDEEPDDEARALIEEFSQIRALYGAEDPYVLIEADYEAAELWTAAFYSEDDVMLQDLLSGDFHSAASETMFKVKRENFSPEHWKGMRRESKYVTFGVLYNRQAKSLYKPAAGQGGNLGKKYSLREIEQMVRAWHERYWMHARWAAEEVRKAADLGEQENIAGRRRRYHAPSLYGGHFANMVVNFPIQSTAHDHLIMSHIELDKMYREGTLPARSLWDGHDAIFFECHKDKVDEACQIIKSVMEKPRWFDRGIPVEIKVGRNWRDGKVWNSPTTQ